MFAVVRAFLLSVTEVTDSDEPLLHPVHRIRHSVWAFLEEARISVVSAPIDVGFPPAKLVMQLISGKCLSRCVSLAAELGIADLLADGPNDVATLAKATGTRSDALYRVLRALTAVGVFDESPDRQFRNSPFSSTLINGAEHSVRQYARWFGRELHWRMYAGLENSVRTGRPWAVNEHPDKTPFQVLAEHPADQGIFNEAMAELSEADGPAIAQAYDFGRFQQIIDIGGGHGTLAGWIAAKAPQSKITVLDLPHVIESARERLSGDGLSRQLTGYRPCESYGTNRARQTER